MAAEGPRKGEPSTKTMRYGLRTQPAPLVRGSSRRIMSLRFRPAYISVINRRASAEAVISPAVQNQNPLRAHQRDHVPAPPPVEAVSMPERCSPSRWDEKVGVPAANGPRQAMLFYDTVRYGGTYERPKQDKASKVLERQCGP